MAEAFALRFLQESPQRRVGIALPHAVEVEAALNGHAPALELPRGLAVEGLASRDWRRFRHGFGRRLPRRRCRFGLPLRRLFRELGLRARRSLAERSRALGDTRPELGIGLLAMSALAHASSIAQAALTLRQQHDERCSMARAAGD